METPTTRSINSLHLTLYLRSSTDLGLWGAMSRRSPERDSGRQDYGGGPSSHVPRTQTIQDDYEPGQVEGTWRWEDEGDVRVPPSVDLGHAGPFHSESITGGRAYINRDQVVAEALEVFSR
jgi:hypothetical protein